MQLFNVKVYDLLVSEHNLSGQNKKWLKYVEVCVKSVEALAMIHPAGWCGALETRTKFTETRTNLTEAECKNDETCENMSCSDLPSSMFLAYSLFKRSLQRSLGVALGALGVSMQLATCRDEMSWSHEITWLSWNGHLDGSNGESTAGTAGTSCGLYE